MTTQLVKFNKSLTQEAAMTASRTNTGTLYFPTDSNAIILNGKVVGQQDTVTSVAGKTGAITLAKSDVGLGNVDNTSDASKPVSTAQATAIADAKAAGTTAQTNLSTHINNKSNPHDVTKSQVGLGNVDNTADANKSVAYAAKIGSSTTPSTVGSGVKPVYVSSGVVTASSSTVGSSTKPIFMSSGTLTASSSTVGSSTKPVFLSSGTLTASSSTVGGVKQPIYLNAGTITAGTALADAAYKAVDTTITSTSKSSTNLPTTAAVTNYVSSALEASQAVKFTGTFSASTGKITSLVSAWDGSEYIAVDQLLTTGVTWSEIGEDHYVGMFFTNDTAGTWDSNTLEVGDSILFIKKRVDAESSEEIMPDYIVIQTNVETATTTKSGTVKVVSSASTSATTNDVYNVTGANAKITAAVTSAIQALDVAATTLTAGKTLKSISETDGKIAVTTQDISITRSQISNLKLGNDNVQTVATNSATSTSGRTYPIQVDSNNKMVVNVPWTDANTTYSAATSSTLGLVKLGSDTTQTVAANTVSTTANRTYAVQKNSSNQLVVNVPWVDTNTTPLANATTRGGIKIGFTNEDDYETGVYKAGVKLIDENDTDYAASNREMAYVQLPYASSDGAGLMSAEDYDALQAATSNISTLTSSLTWE